jgi:nucleolar protein 12
MFFHPPNANGSQDAMAVDQALLLDGKKMEGDRKLRISRAKTIKRKDKRVQERRPEPKSGKGKIYVPKADPKQQAMLGRASKLLGRAGASQLKKQSEIFEGLRATETSDPGLKKGGTGKKKGKPRARAAARSSAWKNKKH